MKIAGIGARLPKQKEDSVHKQVVNYLKTQYPKVIFRTDGGGLRLPTGLAVKFNALQKQRAYPDLFIAEPRPHMIRVNLRAFESVSSNVNELMSNVMTGIDVVKACPAEPNYHGLFIELKRPDEVLIRPKDAKKIVKGETKLRKKGDWFDDHIEEQAKVLGELRGKGYKAEFAVGFDEAKKLIDEYLKAA